MDAPYTQAVIWPGTTGAAADPVEFENFLSAEFDGARFKFIGEFQTLPTPGEEGTGGRIDAVFAVHQDDIAGFAVKRLAYGMRWVEDAILNEQLRGEQTIYVQAIHDLYSWNDGGQALAEMKAKAKELEGGCGNCDTCSCHD